jgi:hypothetical protein
MSLATESLAAHRPAQSATFRSFAGRSFGEMLTRAGKDGLASVPKVVKAYAYSFATQRAKEIASMSAADQQKLLDSDEALRGVYGAWAGYSDQVDSLPEQEREGRWEALLTDFLRGMYRAKMWPAAVLFVEAEGQYSLSREVETRRFNSIYALVARFYLTPMDRDTRFVELRYENGFKRGSTTAGSNALIASFGVQF